MKKTFLLCALFSLIIGNVFAADDPFQTGPMQRLKDLTDKYSKKVKLDDSNDIFMYAVVSKEPVIKGGVLLKVLECKRIYDLQNGRFTPTGDYTEREITYTYQDLRDDTLGINLRVEQSKEAGSSVKLFEVAVDKIINVPLAGSIKKEGTLALSYTGEDGSQENLSENHHIVFIFAEPDRILVEVKPQKASERF